MKNVKTRFGGVGSVCQCNGDCVPTAPTAVNLKNKRTPAPFIGALAKQAVFNRPAVPEFTLQPKSGSIVPTVVQH